MRYITKKVAKNICETIGEVQRSTGGVDEKGGHFIRVRVVVDITLPEEGLLHWKMESKVGLNSNMSDYQTYVIGVGDWIITIKTAIYG